MNDNGNPFNETTDPILYFEYNLGYNTAIETPTEYGIFDGVVDIKQMPWTTGFNAGMRTNLMINLLKNTINEND